MNSSRSSVTATNREHEAINGKTIESKRQRDYELGIQETISAGKAKFKRLGWKRLTVCLVVEAIALGSLSIPSVFVETGMVAGVFLCVGLGLIAIYTSYLVGQVKLKYPEIEHYSDAVGLCWGRFGKEFTGVMFVLLLILLVGGHTLTGTIALIRIVDKPTLCALIWGGVSAIILYGLAFHHPSPNLPSSDTNRSQRLAGWPGGVEWSVWPPEGVTFASAFLSCTNIIFAYSFAVCQFSFMGEMHTPRDYVKSIWALGILEIIIYTTTGALVYAFVGNEVKSPAILSAGFTLSRVAFGVALPVIFISGSINTTVACRYLVNRIFKNSPIRYTNTVRGWAIWATFCLVATIIAWIIAEAVPFFNDLLGLISSLFISGFTFYFPALFWFCLLKEGKWNQGTKNVCLSVINGVIFIMGLAILVCGAYASIVDTMGKYKSGKVGSPFGCDSEQYME